MKKEKININDLVNNIREWDWMGISIAECNVCSSTITYRRKEIIKHYLNHHPFFVYNNKRIYEILNKPKK